MEITDIRAVELQGTIPVDQPDQFWEERVSRPVDIYDEFRSQGPAVTTHGTPTDDGLRVEQYFVIVETNEGIRGLAGPLTKRWAEHALDLTDVLLGQDPLATRKTWDLMYRSSVHGRKGIEMHAISALDCALWDCKGKYFDEPIHRLLGGPTRTELDTYASMLGFSVEPDRVRERARSYAEKGYSSQKWFFRHGPGSGQEGIEKNVALAEAARTALGDDADLMLDCWMSWTREYALSMVERLEPYSPRWLEEPVMPDQFDQYPEIRREAQFPIAGGEHEATRWGMKQLLDAEAVDVLQPDVYWAGGITELDRICSVASVYDVPVVPHGHSPAATAHVVAAHPPTHCPLVEFLVKWNRINQYFLQDRIKPEDGRVTVPEGPGLGVTIDDAKVESRNEIHPH